MLIISSFRDYYDTAIAYGMDRSTVYQREHRIIPDIVLPYTYPIVLDGYDSEYCIIGFCGKVYSCWRYAVAREEISPFRGGTIKNWRVVFNGDILTTFQELRADLEEGDRYDGRRGRYRYFSHNVGSIADESSRFDLMPFHREYQAPVVCLSHTSSDYTHLEINPRLQDYEFFRIVDAFTAFQEIQMFISGVLGTEGVPMLNVAEKNRLEAHGLDPKWSFRNPDPPKRKQKKRGGR